MKRLQLLIALLGAFCLFSSQSRNGKLTQHENSFVIEGMQVEWEYNGDLLTFKLHSPYQGWIGLGFNAANDIVNTNLIMGAVAGETIKLEEFYVLGVGNPQPISELGGQKTVQDYLGIEDATGTSFQFSIDTSLRDEFHYDLGEGQSIWLICAYSMEDDFGHHSIMRRHVEVKL